jgi:hypothetical protein
MARFGALPSVVWRAAYGFLSFVELVDARRVSSRLAHALSPAETPQLWRALRPGYVTIAFARWLTDASLPDILAFDAVYGFAAECQRSPGMLALARDGVDAAAVAACRHGHLAKLQWLADGPLQHELGPIPLEGLRRACEGEHLPVVRWFLARDMWTQAPWCVFAGACEYGRESIIKYLHSEGLIDKHIVCYGAVIYSERTTDPLSLVCKHGHLGVLQWMVETFHLERVEVYRAGLQLAYEEGHAPIVEWLTDRFGEVGEQMLASACIGGHLPTVQRLLGPWPVGDHDQIHECVRLSCMHGRRHVAGWLITAWARHADVTHHVGRAFRVACEHGHHDIAQWILGAFPTVSDDPRFSSTRLICAACRAGHLATLQWLVVSFGPVARVERASVLSAAHGRPAVVQWLTTRFKFGQDAIRLALHAACVQGQLESARFLASRMSTVDWPSLLRSVCECGHLPVAQWLLAFNTVERARTVWHPAWINALDAGHTPIVADLAGRFGFTVDDARRCTALLRAVQGGHLDLAYWLVVRFGLDAEAARLALDAETARQTLDGHPRYNRAAQWLRLRFELDEDDPNRVD